MPLFDFHRQPFRKKIGWDRSDIVRGTTTYDILGAAFASVIAEWRRTDQIYTQRVAHLKSGGVDSFNGTNFLNATTLIDDVFTNSLTGGLDNDWFFGKTSGTLLDKLTDRIAGTEQSN